MLLTLWLHPAESEMTKKGVTDTRKSSKGHQAKGNLHAFPWAISSLRFPSFLYLLSRAAFLQGRLRQRHAHVPTQGPHHLCPTPRIDGGSKRPLPHGRHAAELLRDAHALAPELRGEKLAQPRTRLHVQQAFVEVPDDPTSPSAEQHSTAQHKLRSGYM